MRVGLVTHLYESVRSNPGCDMITAGIRWLVRQAVPDAVFVVVNMGRDDPQDWAAAHTCDALIVCGNPRFSMSTDGAWWESGIWDRLLVAQQAGIRVIDGWAGATHGHAPEVTFDEMAAAVAGFGRNPQSLEVAKQLHGRVTRDRLMQRIYEDAGATLLPCSSWWAERELMWAPAERRPTTAVMLGQHDMEWSLERVLEHLGDALVVASTWQDYERFREVGVQSTLIPDAASLLRLYSSCERVLAFRIHAAIPAASVGCAVGVVAIDSRAMTCEEFGLPVIGIDELDSRDPEFALAKKPDDAAVVGVLQGLLC